MTEPACVWAVQAELGEGPVWWPEAESLLFVDIKAPAILSWKPGDITRRWAMPAEIGAVVLRRGGGWLAALRSGLAFVSPSTGVIEHFAAPEADIPGNRFNDGKCDPKGRFWVASMDDTMTKPTGRIWCLDGNLGLVAKDGGFIIGNGFGWNQEGRRMYFTDSENRTIHVYDYDPATGALGRRSIFATVSSDCGYPDGLCVDSEDHVWSAHWDGWRITRYRPDGSVARVIDFPVPRPTSLAFGGGNLDRLYVTSARIGLSAALLAKAPLSGGLFELDVGVCGRPEPRFAG